MRAPKFIFAHLLFWLLGMTCLQQSQAQVFFHERFSPPVDTSSFNGWKVYALPGGGATTKWQFGPRPSNPNGLGQVTGAGFDSAFAYMDSQTWPATDTQYVALLSPQFSTFGAYFLVLSFAESWLGYQGNQAWIEVSRDGGANWDTLLERSPTQQVGQPLVGGLSQAQRNRAFLPSTYNNQPSVQLRFTYKGTNGFWWAFDDVAVFNYPFTDGRPLEVYPSSYCSASDTLRPFIRLRNNGQDTLRQVCINFEVPQRPVLRDTLAKIPPRTTIEHLFAHTQVWDTAGAFPFVLRLDAQNEDQPLNDTLWGSLGTAQPLNFPSTDFKDSLFTQDGQVNDNYVYKRGLFPTQAEPIGQPYTVSQFFPHAIRAYVTPNFRNTWLLPGKSFSMDSAGALEIDYAITQTKSYWPAQLEPSDHFFLAIGRACGRDWDTLAPFPAYQDTGTLATARFDLSAYQGEEINVAVYLSVGDTHSTAYKVHIGALRMDYDLPYDLELVELLSPEDWYCEPMQAPVVTALVANRGRDTLSNPLIAYRLNSQPERLLGSSLVLPPGQTDTLRIALPQGAASPDQQHRVEVRISDPRDAIPYNNQAPSLRFSTYKAMLPPLDFSAFSGNNLSTVYEGWAEYQDLHLSTEGSAWQRAVSLQEQAWARPAARFFLYGNQVDGLLLSPPFLVEDSLSLHWEMALRQYLDSLPAHMGLDDTFALLVGPACQASWDTALVLKGLQGNLMKEDWAYSLQQYEGQVIRLGFYASAGSVGDAQEYDLLLAHIRTEKRKDEKPQAVYLKVLNASTCQLPDSLDLEMGINQAAQSDSLHIQWWKGNNLLGQWAVFASSGLSVWAPTLPAVDLPGSFFVVRKAGGSQGDTLWAPASLADLSTFPQEDFEQLTPSFNSQGWSQGWSSQPSNTTLNFRWNLGSSTPTTGTGPQTGAGGSSQFAYVEASSGNYNDEAILESPCIQLAGAHGLEVHFAYHAFGEQVGRLTVEALDSTGQWQPCGQLGRLHFSDSAPWVDTTFWAAGLAGESKLRFRAIRGTGIRGDLAIDALRIQAIPDHELALYLEPGMVSNFYNCDSLYSPFKLLNRGGLPYQVPEDQLYVHNGQEVQYYPLSQIQPGHSDLVLHYAAGLQSQPFLAQQSAWLYGPSADGAGTAAGRNFAGTSPELPLLNTGVPMRNSYLAGSSFGWALARYDLGRSGFLAEEPPTAPPANWDETNAFLLPRSGGRYLLSPWFAADTADTLSIDLGLYSRDGFPAQVDSLQAVFEMYYQDSCSASLQLWKRDTLSSGDTQVKLPFPHSGRMRMALNQRSSDTTLLRLGLHAMQLNPKNDLALLGYGTAGHTYQRGDSLTALLLNRSLQERSTQLAVQIGDSTYRYAVQVQGQQKGVQEEALAPLEDWAMDSSRLSVCMWLEPNFSDVLPGNDSLCHPFQVTHLRENNYTALGYGEVPVYLYPNPSRGRIYLSWPAVWPNRTQVHVLNAVGQVQQEWTVLSRQQGLSVAEWQPGLYYLHFKQDDRVFCLPLLRP